jgi:hypothetical protein
MASPVFVVTDAGLANTFPDPNYPNRVIIHITDFEVGSAYGQTATRNDTGLFGNRLFGPTAPTTYANIPAGGVDIVLTIPADAGPFDYGEVGIYNTGPNGRTLFAHAVFDQPQTKYSSLETNVGSSEVFHALLRLEQATAVFKIDTLIDMTLLTVDLWSDVNPPGTGMDPSLPLTRVLEADPGGDASLLINANPNHWTVGTTYEPMFVTQIMNATTTSIDVPDTPFQATDLTNVNRKYVIEFQNTGLFRSATNLVQAGPNYRFNLNPAPLPDIPTVGAPVRIYESVALKTIGLATIGNPGIVAPGKGIALPAPGLFETYGLLHGVTGAGKPLNSTDNLTSNILPSGEYGYSDFPNIPAGSPPNVTNGGRIRISNYEGYIVQQVFPRATGTGPVDLTNANNQIWWRIGWNNGAAWSDWRTMGAQPKPPANPTFTTRGTLNRTSFTFDTTRTTTLSGWVNKSSSHLNLYYGDLSNQIGREDGEGGGMISYTAPPGVRLIISHDGTSEDCPIATLEWDA